MGRKAHIDFRARRSLPQLLLKLKSKPVDDWPEPLLGAWRILNGEMELGSAKALSVILESVSAAHQFGRAQNQQLNDLVEARARARIRTACGRISKGINRAPAALRRRLDQAILPLIRGSIIDLEVVESIFEVATTIFEEFADSESSSTAVRALRELRTTPFFMLGMALRQKVEKAIAGFPAASSAKHQATATDVFATVAAVLDGDKTIKLSTQNRELVAHYVAELAAIWRRAGLKPSRVFDFLNSKHRSKFHRFAELVLTAMVDPCAERVSSRELVSDDDVRTAFRRRFKF